MLTRKRLWFAIAMLVVAIAIISSTLGREVLAGRTPGLMSFGVIHFAGYLFFLLMPVEALVPYYLSEGHAGLVLVTVAVGTAVAAQLIDYGIGRMVSDDVIRNVIGERRFDKAHHTIMRHGYWAILVFNLLPLSSPNMLLVSGMVKYPLRQAMLWSITGLVGKYFAIVYLFTLF